MGVGRDDKRRKPGITVERIIRVFWPGACLRLTAMKLFSLRKGAAKAVEPELVRLVVVEDGVQGFESRVPRDEGDETIVVVQSGGESPVALMMRVAARIAVIERSEKKVGQAIVLVGNRHDTQEASARWLIARACLSHLHSNAGTELVLDALGAEPEVRHELLALVETLLEKNKQRSIPIRLQFRKEAPSVGQRSGVYPGVTASDGALHRTGTELS